MICCASCAPSSDLPEAERPALPSMPLDLVKGCPDVPVDPDAFRALVEHRRALADCRRLQARTVDFYANAKRNVEGAP